MNARPGRISATNSNIRHNKMRTLLLASTLISGMTLMVPAPASSAGEGVAFREISQSQDISFNIPAQGLDTALTALADQAGLQLFFPSQGMDGVAAPAITGTFSIDQALTRLLSGSGYSWRYTADGTVTIEKLAAGTGDDSILDPVRIEASGTRQTATGPTEGYGATRSLSATKTDRPLIETPQSISVVTKDQIEDQGSQTVMQAMRYTPGAFTGQVGASNRYDYVILRGLVDRSIDNIYLDGLKTMSDDSTYSSMQIDPYFVERADVVKGPASVLYGRSSPGGLVALSSKKPLFEQQGEVEVSYGNRNQRGVGFDVTGPLTESGKLAYRLVGKADASDTQFDGTKEERYTIAPSLTANVSDDTRITLMGYFQKDPEGGTHNGLPSEGTLFPRNGQYIPNSFFDGDPSLESYERTQNMVGYEFEHEFDDTWAVRQNFRFLDADVHLDQIYQTGWNGATNELTRTYGGGDEDLRAFTVDNQAQANFTTANVDHTVLMGFDYQNRRTENKWLFTGASTINPFDPVYGNPGVALGTITNSNRRSLEQAGLYAEDQFSYENWRFSLGLRQDWVETSNLNRLTNVEQGEDRSKLTKRAGILYLFDNGIAPYINYSESFNPSLSSDASGKPLEPTEGTQYEIGLKYQPTGSSAMFSAALFHIDQENVAIYNNTTFAYEPIGTIESQGLELEARGDLTNSFSVVAGYTYTDASYDAPGSVKDGNRPQQVPEHMASLWGHYRFTAGTLDGLGIGAGVRYIGETAGNEANTIMVPDYTLVDLVLNYDLSQIGITNADFRLNVNNLMDEDYVASCLITQWSDNCYYGEERTVLATLRYRF
ncbi:TonB-dependent siderophore receptor [Thalassospira sp.]|uniref:TonB-dependent siderophore receptor n=1 Tax=Thalassospira sp. TaxID=1912094 RepID=UPI002734DBDE|nr:TonB-dependent siderophore receptor [Thalassospira sp.]MDP2696733.1 TonB-dependent siderophore receptor [Thalassospira sp.]